MYKHKTIYVCPCYFFPITIKVLKGRLCLTIDIFLLPAMKHKYFSTQLQYHTIKSIQVDDKELVMKQWLLKDIYLDWSILLHLHYFSNSFNFFLYCLIHEFIVQYCT